MMRLYEILVTRAQQIFKHTLKFLKSSCINVLMGSATIDSIFFAVETKPFQMSRELSPLLRIDSKV